MTPETECVKATEMRAAQGLSTTVGDARFAKPLDRDLVVRLARAGMADDCRGGAIGRSGSHVVKLLSERGVSMVGSSPDRLWSLDGARRVKWSSVQGRLPDLADACYGNGSGVFYHPR